MSQSRTGRSPGRPKGTEQTPPMRDTVLNAASELFMEFGYEPISLNQIAKKAGVTKASIYYYFSNKAELFTASVTSMMVRISMITARILEQEGTLYERLTQLAVAKMAKSHVEFESMMREAIPSLSPEQREAIRQAEHGIHRVLADCFTKAVASGELAKTADPLLLSHAFAALLMIGNRELEPYEGVVSREELPIRLMELFWRGIGPGRTD